MHPYLHLLGNLYDYLLSLDECTITYMGEVMELSEVFADDGASPLLFAEAQSYFEMIAMESVPAIEKDDDEHILWLPVFSLGVKANNDSALGFELVHGGGYNEFESGYDSPFYGVMPLLFLQHALLGDRIVLPNEQEPLDIELQLLYSNVCGLMDEHDYPAPL